MRECCEQRPEKCAATTSNVQKRLRLQPAQNTQRPLDPRQFRIQLELMQAQSGRDPVFDRRAWFPEAAADKRVREFGGISLHSYELKPLAYN